MSIMIWGTMFIMIGISAAQMLILTNKNGETNENQIYPPTCRFIHVDSSAKKWFKTHKHDDLKPFHLPNDAVASGVEIHGLPHPKDHFKVISVGFFLDPHLTPNIS